MSRKQGLHESKPIVLAGNFLERNFGDDVMLAGYLAAHGSSAERYVVLAQSLPQRSRSFLRDAALVPWTITHALKWVGRSREFVQVGGTHLQFLRSHSRAGQYRAIGGWVAHVMWARLTGSRVIFANVGLGPFESRAARALSRVALRMANEVSVRDESSRVIAARLRVECTLVDDLAIDYLRAQVLHKRGMSVDGSRVLLAPSFENFDLDWWKHRIAEAFASTYDPKFTLLESGRQRSGDDSVVVDQLRTYIEATGSERATLRSVRYEGNVDEIIDLIASSSVVFAARYHVVLIARALGRPVIANAYHPKVYDAMRIETLG